MKTIKILSILVIAGVAVLLTSCSETVNNVEDVFALANDEKSTELAAGARDGCYCDFSRTLTEEEIEGLMEMREEEKLARDVYLALYKKHEHIVFRNISKSEDAHTRAVLHLINGFGLFDPALENEGEFNNELFVTLYQDLTEKGNASLVEALKIGVFIEEYDIADLERLLAETENETIQRVYSNLLRGSKNHIRAFTNALTQLGESYTPTVITQEEYEEILSESSFKTNRDFTPGTGECNGAGPNA
jgi:hypothetical protein